MWKIIQKLSCDPAVPIVQVENENQNVTNGLELAMQLLAMKEFR